MWLDGLQFAAGLAVLVAGAEALVRGGVRTARAFGVSPFLIGLTLIGFGTSAPELVVNLSAALAGSPGLAVGNVVGSNVANVGLILGLAAVVRPLDAEMRLLRVELPVLVGVSGLLLALCWDDHLGRADGAVLLAGFAGMTAYVYRAARAEPPAVKAEIGKEAGRRAGWGLGVGLAAAGLVGLVGGAELMVRAATAAARAFGMSELVIGLTVLAVGTSLPELATTVAAARRGESDIAVGNVVGSNVFNILLILGTTAVVAPLPLADAPVRLDLAVMCGFALALVLVLANGLRVYRWEGGLLLAGYAGYLGWQVARAAAG